MFADTEALKGGNVAKGSYRDYMKRMKDRANLIGSIYHQTTWIEAWFNYLDKKKKNMYITRKRRKLWKD
jgi:hypothetical protein